MLTKEIRNQMITYLLGNRIIGDYEIKNSSKLDILLNTLKDMYEEDIKKNPYYILYKNMTSNPDLNETEEALRIEFILQKTFKDVMNLDVIKSLVHTLFEEVY